MRKPRANRLITGVVAEGFPCGTCAAAAGPRSAPASDAWAKGRRRYRLAAARGAPPELLDTTSRSPRSSPSLSISQLTHCRHQCGSALAPA